MSVVDTVVPDPRLRVDADADPGALVASDRVSGVVVETRRHEAGRLASFMSTSESCGTETAIPSREARRVVENPTRGVLYALIAGFGFALMGYFVHAANGVIGGPELAFWRGFVTCVALAPFLGRDVARLFGPGAGWLWMRSLAGAGSVLCFFTTLQQTGLGAARALADMAPVFVCLLAWIRGDERPTVAQSLVIGAMTAAAVSLELGAVAGLGTATIAIGLCGGFSASLAYVALRRAAQRFSNSLVVFGLGAGLMATAPLAPGASISVPPSEALVPLIGVGVLGVVAQLVFTRVFFHVSAPIASALSVVALPLSVGLDVVLVGNVPTAFAAACYAAIMLGAAALHALEVRRKRALPGVEAPPID